MQYSQSQTYRKLYKKEQFYLKTFHIQTFLVPKPPVGVSRSRLYLRQAAMAKKKATEMNQAQLEQEQEPPVMDMDIQISEENLIAREQSLSDLSDIFEIMKSKIDPKKLELDISNKQRIIDSFNMWRCKPTLYDSIPPVSDMERVESLIANKSANWLLVA